MISAHKNARLFIYKCKRFHQDSENLIFKSVKLGWFYLFSFFVMLLNSLLKQPLNQLNIHEINHRK